MAKSYDFYEKVARNYDEMYEEITWHVHHGIIRRILEGEIERRSPERIMDLGAGTGRWSFFFAKKGLEVTAIEPSGKMIEVMKEKVPEGLPAKISFVKSAAEKMEFQEEFDLVNAQGDVLSYLEDPDGGLKRIRNALKPGGLFVGTADSKYAFLRDLARMGEFGEIKAVERNPALFIGDPSVDSTFRTRLFTPETLSGFLENQGFEVVEISGIIVFGPYDDSVRSKFDETVENEFSYKDDPALIPQAAHLHFKAAKR